jgi:hypothetical protein
MAADIIARGLAAKTFAAVRACSIAIEEMGATGVGNDQPAIQRAVDTAILHGVPRVTARLPRLEMWCPPRLNGFSASPDGIPLVVDAPLHLDFGGAAITLKGVDGGDRFVGQPVGGYNDGADKPWIGGWLYVVGNPNFTRVVLENVTVDGGFSGDVHSNAASNVTDKGFRIQDSYVGEVVLRNVELKNFAGEICYLGLTGDTRTVVDNCRFHGSPQSAWNPSVTGRLVAINLEAGRAYAPAEVIGGRGQSYIGGRFYDGYTSAFIGGPDPGPQSGYPFQYAIRRNDAPPPFLSFIGTRFESMPGALSLTSFVRGSIVTVDTPVWLTHAGVGHLQDIDLEIEAWADRVNAFEGVGLFGPLDLATQVGGAPDGTIYQKTSNIDVRIRCRRTALAASNGHRINPGARLYAGLYDRDSVRLRVSGECAAAWGVIGATPPGFAVPRIESAVSYPPADFAEGGAIAIWSASTAHKVESAAVTAFHGGSGTIDIAIDTANGYAHGQRFAIYYSGNDSSKVLAFARNGAGMRLNADRTLRRTGEYLALAYDKDAGLWVEAAYLDPSGTREPLPIDTTSGLAAFSAAPWTLDGVTLAAAGIPGPYGAGEAIRATLSATPFALIARASVGKRTVRARVKAGTTDLVNVFFDTAAGFSQAAFNLTSGVGNYSPDVDGSIAPLGGGWFGIEATARCSNRLGIGFGGSVGQDAVVFDLLLYDG